MFETSLNQRESRIEWPMLVALIGLMILGAAFIYSATSVNELARQVASYRQPFFKQIIFYLIGAGMGLGICLLDYRRIGRWSLVVYWATIVLLVMVLIPKIGSTHGWGARRWIDL